MVIIKKRKMPKTKKAKRHRRAHVVKPVARPVAGAKLTALEGKLIKQLIENSLKIEKKSVELLLHISKLTERMDRFLDIFEKASKHVTEVETTEERLTGLSKRLESLLEQNKAIAKGLILLEKYVKGKTELRPAAAPKQLSEYSAL